VFLTRSIATNGVSGGEAGERATAVDEKGVWWCPDPVEVASRRGEGGDALAAAAAEYARERRAHAERWCALAAERAPSVLDAERSWGGVTLVVPRECPPWLVGMDGKVLRHMPQLARSSAVKEAILTDHGTAVLLLADLASVYRATADDSWPCMEYATGFAEVDWDGNVAWECDVATDSRQPHHSFTILPNGNLLALMYRKHSWAECFERGLDPNGPRGDTLAGSWCRDDGVVEFARTESSDGGGCEPVWEWWSMDHLVQDRNVSAANYAADVSAHPRRFDVNYYKDIGLSAARMPKDWSQLHSNSIAYSARRDHILISSVETAEVFVVDHAMSSEEARTGAGGVVYRHGNPRAYRPSQDAALDREWATTHATFWIEDENEQLPTTTKAKKEGAEEVHILAFVNNVIADFSAPSRVDEIALPPLTADGRGYVGSGGEASLCAWPPCNHTWRFASDDTSHKSFIYGSAQRLPNGNTLVTYGVATVIVEVTPAGEVVWEYAEPYQDMTFRSKSDNITKCGSDDCHEAYSMWRASRFASDSPQIRQVIDPMKPHSR